VHGLEILREQILRDKHIVGLHTRDAARAHPRHLLIGRAALAVIYDQHVVSHLKFGRTHVCLVVMLLNGSLAIACSLLCHLCLDLSHIIRQPFNLYKRLRLD
jgi:hypothetical protein